ncbi:MAG: hypothetical protein HQL21_03135 [Candidatus Omnitrophica bacterium]|nr:hypothetical protein [Candidatus Omnitrophota bacterium]
MSAERLGGDVASAWNCTYRGNQKYDAWLQWSVVDICNMKCDFCLLPLNQQDAPDSKKRIFEKFFNTIKVCGFSGAFSVFQSVFRQALPRRGPGRINIPALMRTLARTGRTFRIGFTGGEPFLIPNLVEACEALTTKHYISLNTNLVSNDIKKFCDRIDPLRVVHFHASTHIKELERLNLLERYISNFVLCQTKGFNIFSREVAYPPLLSEVEKYKKLFGERGIDLTFGPFIGWYDGKQYPQAYTDDDIRAFGLNTTSDSDIRHFYQQGKLCNAGYNVGVVDAYGEIRPCYSIYRTLGNIYGDIRFRDKLIKCPFGFCDCPLKDFDNYLFDRALKGRPIASGK